MELFFAGFLLSLSLCLDIGIVNVAIIKNSIEKNSIEGFMVGFGSCFGDLFYAILSFAGLVLVLEYTVVRWVLWIGGSLILLFLAVKAILQTFSKQNALSTENSSNEKKHIKTQFFNGLLLALSSPSAILWFAALGGSIIASMEIESKTMISVFLAGFFVAGMIWSLSLALVSYHGVKLLGEKVVKAFSFASAMVFIYFAARVFWDGYTTLL